MSAPLRGVLPHSWFAGSPRTMGTEREGDRADFVLVAVLADPDPVERGFHRFRAADGEDGREAGSGPEADLSDREVADSREQQPRRLGALLHSDLGEGG